MPYNLLIIEGQKHVDWQPVFQGACLVDGQDVIVHQAPWDDVTFVSNERGLRCIMRPTERHTPPTSIMVDFLMLRSVTQGIKGMDGRHKLFTLMHAGVPSCNSLHSVHMLLERPVMFGALKSLQRELGEEVVPLIPQELHSSASTMVIPPFDKGVAKLGHADAGFGKLRYEGLYAYQDVKSVAQLHDDYVALEPFVDWEWDMRVQKVGRYVRVYRRSSPDWKANRVGTFGEEIEPTPQQREMIEAVAQCFGGLDWCAVDMLVEKETGKSYILEVNGTAIGLSGDNEASDMNRMKDVVISRMNSALLPNKFPHELRQHGADLPSMSERAIENALHQRD